MKKNLISVDIKEQFIDLYNQGVYKHGEKIPPEVKMSEHFGVSRETWRSALKLLIKEGILCSRQGSGTYVCEKPTIIANDLSVLTSLFSDIGNISKSAATCTIQTLNSKEIVDAFGENQQFYILKRVRFQNDETISASKNCIPVKYNLDINNIPNSIFSFFKEQHNINISRAVSEITVPDTNDELYKMLHLPENTNALQLNQLHFDSTGAPVFYSCDYLRCDKFKFTINRTR